MKQLSPRLRGTIEISIASMGFGFLGVFGKMAYGAGLSVGELLSYRFTLAAILIWIGLLLFRPQWVRLTGRQLFIAAMLGIFGYAFFSTLYFKAVEGLSITLAALLLYTYPFWVNLFSHFFTHDKVTRKELFALIAASFGLVLLLWGHIEIKDMWAVAAGIGAAISYAIYVMLSGRLQKDVRPVSSALYVITFGALALCVFHQPSMSHAMELPPTAATAVIGLAIICTVIPLSLELAALQKLKSNEVALLMMIEPVTAAILGAVIFGERLEIQQIVGALIILGALVSNTLRKRDAIESLSRQAK